MEKIILEFIGGSWDGRNLSNDSIDPVEIRLAVRKYLRTDGGAVGRTVVLPVDYPSAFFVDHDDEATAASGRASQTYVVTERTEIGDDVLVRFEYRAACPRADRVG